VTDKSFLAGVPSGDATVPSRENRVEGQATRNGSEIQTWTLSERRSWDGVPSGDFRVKPENECSFSDETLYRVIEADPVLDLLERHLPIDGKPRCAVDRETVALLKALKANGRLA
jgi:hypothetical protein